jgi:hypothetical protein
MNTNLPEENQLRAMFGKLRQSDDRTAPGFDAGQARAAHRPASLWSQLRYDRLAGAVAVLLLIGIGAVVVSLSHPNHVMALKPTMNNSEVAPAAEQPASLDTWQSPTAFLLQASDQWGSPPDSQTEPTQMFPATQPKPQRSTG